MMLALHRACREGNLVLVSILLEKGLNVNAKDKQGRSPLHIASEKGDKLLAELLFQRGTDTSSVTSRGHIPLDCTHDKGMTLWLARIMTQEGKGRLVQERLQFGKLSENARPKIAKDLDVRAARDEMWSHLFGRRSEPSSLEIKDSESSLANVSESNPPSEVESGFSEVDKTPDSTSLESIQTNGSSSSGFASVDETTPPLNRRATTALTKDEFQSLTSSSFISRCRTVSEPPPRPIKRASTWSTSKRTNSASARLKTSAIKKSPAKRVSFPSNVLLDIAIRNDDFVEACLLIKARKVDLNGFTCNNLSPLHVAAIEGSYECLQLLIGLGANVSAQDEHGWTPLHDAVFHGHPNSVQLLIDAGADLSAETNDLRTVMDLAEDDIMIRIVGRSMACKFGQEDDDDVFHHRETSLPERVFGPDRETCV